MPSYAVIAAAAIVFVVFLVRNDRQAAGHVRAEDRAIERMEALAKEPPAPPRVEGGYRFEWETGGDLPPLLLAFPEGKGVCLLAAAGGRGAYSYELFGGGRPDVTRFRVHLARAEGGSPLPPGWRKVR